MRDEDYIIRFGWMTNRLGLKGSEADVYAIIYSFSRDGESEFFGSSTYLADLAGISKRRVIDILSSLVDRGLVHKSEVNRNGIRYCSYAVTMDNLPSSAGNFTGGEIISPGVVKEFHRGGEKISPNNIYDSIDLFTKEKSEKEKSPKKFVRPSVEEVAEYIREKGYSVDAEIFHSYYESNGWRVGGNPMKDWRAAIVTWQKKETNKKERYGKTYGRAADSIPSSRVNHDWSQDRSDF